MDKCMEKVDYNGGTLLSTMEITPKDKKMGMGSSSLIRGNILKGSGLRASKMEWE